NRPQYLIEVFPVAEEGLAQQSFGRRAQLPEGGVAAPVRDGGTRFEPVDADFVEYELHDRERSFLEQAGAPVFASDCESPLRRGEVALELADLDDANRVLASLGDDAEADVASARLLVQRPGDETLETF